MLSPDNKIEQQYNAIDQLLDYWSICDQNTKNISVFFAALLK
jgi:hypothetical protein